MTILAFIFGVVITLLVLGVVTYCKDTQPKNNVHFYIARDTDKELWLYLGKPVREETNGFFIHNRRGAYVCKNNDFEDFGLNIDNYKDLKWEDEPKEVFLDLED